MAVVRYIVPVLAVAGYAAAATCSAATTTIQNGGDATALASCRTFTGSIALATSVGGNIALDGVEEITGSLIATNVSQLQALSGSSLTTIGNEFVLTDLTGLASLNFPLLANVKTVTWTTLNLLQGLMFQTGLQKVSSLTISDTGLASLKGINLQVADSVNINNNAYLKEINMQLGNVTQLLDIHSNAVGLAVSLPNLMWANMLTIRNAASVSIPSLSAVNDSVGFYSNTFQTLTAPNLTSVQQTLAVDSNNMLSNVTFPQLTTIGGALQIQNNTALSKVNGLPNLQKVNGAVAIYGTFTELDLPSINLVLGDFDIRSSQDIASTCSHFNSLHGSGSPIRGHVTCDPNSNPNVTSNTTGGTDTSSGSSASPSPSKGLATPLLIPGATGLLGVVAAIFGLL